MTTDTLARDIAALRLAIDAGDDSALGPLADALEEAGDPSADGLRKAIEAKKRPSSFGRAGNISWWRDILPDGRFDVLADWLPQKVYDRLADTEANYVGRHWAEYPSRSAAYLALAEALTPEE